MITAVMLIKAHLRDIAGVIDALSEIEQINQLYTTTGQYDIVAVLQVKDTEALADVVTHRIAGITGIADTSTLLAIRCHSPKLMESMFGVGMSTVEKKSEEGPKEG